MLTLQEDWIDAFLAEQGRRNLSKKSLSTYSSFLHNLSKYNLDLQTATSEELFHCLDAIRQSRKNATYTLYCYLIKKALQFLERKDLADKIHLPKPSDPAGSIKILSAEERKTLIVRAPTLQDRLLIEILDETGARIGEVSNLRIKDVQFDQYGAILNLVGKTGRRRRRVYTATADLRNHLNNHPYKDNPEIALFARPKSGKAFSIWDHYRRVKQLGRDLLHREINPHMFRHTRATEDSRNFTDREMMQLFGWKRPDMVSVYSHLSMRDVEDKDLMLHGLKRRDEILQPIVHAEKCGNCKQENAPLSIYCVNCSAVLHREDVTGAIEKSLNDPKLIEALTHNKEFLEALKKALKQ